MGLSIPYQNGRKQKRNHRERKRTRWLCTIPVNLKRLRETVRTLFWRNRLFWEPVRRLPPLHGCFFSLSGDNLPRTAYMKCIFWNLLVSDCQGQWPVQDIVWHIGRSWCMKQKLWELILLRRLFYKGGFPVILIHCLFRRNELFGVFAGQKPLTAGNLQRPAFRMRTGA